MSRSRFAQLHEAGHLTEVRMNEVEILLPEAAGVAIGTRNLNGCSAIAVLGKAIILAHIAPLPPGINPQSNPNDIPADAGDNHFRDLLGRVIRIYHANQQHFPQATTAWRIFGRIGGGDAMLEKAEIAGRAFDALGLPSHDPKFYTVEPSQERHNPAAGTAIGIHHQRHSYLYLEDRLLHSVEWPGDVAPDSQALQQVSMPSQVRRRGIMPDGRELQQARTAYQELIRRGVPPETALSRVRGVMVQQGLGEQQIEEYLAQIAGSG